MFPSTAINDTAILNRLKTEKLEMLNFLTLRIKYMISSISAFSVWVRDLILNDLDPPTNPNR